MFDILSIGGSISVLLAFIVESTETDEDVVLIFRVLSNHRLDQLLPPQNVRRCKSEVKPYA